MGSQPSSPILPSEEEIRKLAGRQLNEVIAQHFFDGRPESIRAGSWTLDDTREIEEMVIRKLGLPAYVGALTGLVAGDVGRAIVASPQFRLRACLLALKRDAEDTTR